MERSAETIRDDADGEYLKRNRWFESGSLHQGVMNKLSQAANLPQAANRPTLTGEGLTVRIPFPPAASLARALSLDHFRI